MREDIEAKIQKLSATYNTLGSLKFDFENMEAD